MTASQPAWLSQPSRQSPRALLIVAMTLVSFSGLLTGLALRPLARGLLQSSASHAVTTNPSATQTPSAIVPAIAATPQAFFLGLTITPQTTHAGGVITVRAQTHLSKGSAPAQGISCALSITGPSTLPAGSVLLTDATGAAAWTVTIPSATPPGTYTVAVMATWGDFRADWQVGLVVR